MIRGVLRTVKKRRDPYYRQIGQMPITDCASASLVVNTHRFYGFPTTRGERLLYYLMPADVRHKVCAEAFGVARDASLRYWGPSWTHDKIGHGKYYDLDKGDVVVEVGAFLGMYAVRAAELIGPSGHVVAIEAIPENFEILQKNVARFPNIIPVQCAAWNTETTLTFDRQKKQAASAIKGIVAPEQQLSVPANTIDNIMAGLEVTRVDFVRIQVNGAEHRVLDGMDETLKLRPKLLIAAIYQESWKRIVPRLQSLGYTVTESHGNVFAY